MTICFCATDYNVERIFLRLLGKKVNCSSTMGDFRKKNLRRHLLSEYGHLFDALKGELVLVRDFLGTKTLDNCPQYRGGCVGRDDDEADIDCALLEESADNKEEKNNTSVSGVERSTETDGYNASVRGQTIFGLFDEDTSEEEGPANDSMRFSNGSGIDLEHRVRQVVETPLEKARSEKQFAKEKYTPSDSLIVASVNCFSRKTKRHFFHDGLYLCTVFAKEMSMDLSTFLRVRGWLAKVKNRKGTDEKMVEISYRRVDDCLCMIDKDAAAAYYRMSAMFEHLYRVLNNRDTWPEMPYEGMYLYAGYIFTFLPYGLI